MVYLLFPRLTAFAVIFHVHAFSSMSYFMKNATTKHIAVKEQNRSRLIHLHPNIHPTRCNWQDWTIGEPGATPPTNVRSSPCQCQKSTKTCISIIKWDQRRVTDAALIRYRIKFLKDIENPNDYLDCRAIPKTKRAFNFTFKATDIGSDGIPYVLGSEPIQLRVSMPYYFVDCQLLIEISPELPYKVEVWEGEEYTFRCNYTGLLPEEVIWTHDNDVILNNDTGYRIVKGDMFTTLTIPHLLQKNEGRYSCSVDSYFGERYGGFSEGSIFKVKKRPIISIFSDSAPVTSKPSKSIRHLHFIIAGSLFVGVMILMTALYVIKSRKRGASVFPFWQHGEEQTKTETTT